jgi:hypothetical protein
LTGVAGAADDFDMLVDLRNLNLIHILIELLSNQQNRTNPSLLGSMITILTNMSLNDQNNVKIRLHGAHLIGQILMENCTTYNIENPKHYVRLISFVFKIFDSVKTQEITFRPSTRYSSCVCGF